MAGSAISCKQHLNNIVVESHSLQNPRIPCMSLTSCFRFVRFVQQSTMHDLIYQQIGGRKNCSQNLTLSHQTCLTSTAKKPQYQKNKGIFNEATSAFSPIKQGGTMQCIIPNGEWESSLAVNSDGRSDREITEQCENNLSSLQSGISLFPWL